MNVSEIKSYITKIDAETVLKEAVIFLKKTGPRLTGTDACRKAGNMIHEKWKKICDQTVMDSFKLHRDAFLSVTKILPTFYIIGLGLLYLGEEWIHFGSLILTFGLIILIVELFYYYECIDFLLPETEGNNIVGTVLPQKDTRQTLIFSAHYDSPYVFHFLDKFQTVYKFLIIIGIINYFFVTGLFFWFSFRLLQGGEVIIGSELIIILFLGLFAVIPFYFFITREVSPGFGDNLTAVFTIGKLAEFLSGKHNLPKLKHTRLVFLASDAEESGLRGAREFVRQHIIEFKNHPHFNFNLDSIYKSEYLTFFTSDVNKTVKLSNEQSKNCFDIAMELGFKAKIMSFPIGGGGTDAGEFARGGVEAVSLIGMDTELKDKMNPYHTSRDVEDAVEPEAILAALQIGAMYAYTLDSEFN